MGVLCHQPCRWRHPGPGWPSLWAQIARAIEAAGRASEGHHLQGQLTPSDHFLPPPPRTVNPPRQGAQAGGRGPTACPHLPWGWEPALAQSSVGRFRVWGAAHRPRGPAAVLAGAVAEPVCKGMPIDTQGQRSSPHSPAHASRRVAWARSTLTRQTQGAHTLTATSWPG